MNSGVLRRFVWFCEVYFWRQPQSYRNLGKSVTAFFPELSEKLLASGPVIDTSWLYTN